jgi:FtsP/CotA-like multicopper oxidase with cupredoxin domain
MPRTLQRAAVAALAASLTAALAGCVGAAPISTIGAVDFVSPLPVPALAESTIDADGTRVFSLDAQAGSTEFVSGVSTPTMGFNQPYLGPTLVAEVGETVAVDVTNSLDEPSTVHWHGMHLPPEMDGGPHQMVAPGSTWRPTWTIKQNAATLWYHPHPHGETERQVAMGMAGMFILKDAAEAALPLPRDYGVDDIPVIVQDVQFEGDGEISMDKRDFAGRLGDQLVVNGVVGPYLDVTTDVVRLRLLNGSSARIYNFAFADDRQFAMIASDGGLLQQSLPLTHVQLSPGERAEILVTMAPGETVVLQSQVPDLGGTVAFVSTGGGSDSFDVLELRAAATLESRGSVPQSLVPVTRLEESAASAERRFDLDGTQINQEEMDLSRIDEVVTVGATEIWNVRNGMAAPHSFHVHDVQFQLLAIGGAPPPAELAGWKDTIYLRPNTDYRLIMRFEDYTDPDTPYMYHCHLLRHEDDGMMGQFIVVKPGERPGTIEGNHNDH